jgi:hypothetical protein
MTTTAGHPFLLTLHSPQFMGTDAIRGLMVWIGNIQVCNCTSFNHVLLDLFLNAFWCLLKTHFLLHQHM